MQDKKPLEAYEKVLKEYDKVLKEYEKVIKEPEKSPGIQATLKKAEESIQKARDMVEKLKDMDVNIDRDVNIDGGYIGGEGDVFFNGAGAGGSLGGKLSGFDLSAGRIIWDGRTGQLIASGPSSMAITSDPEAKGLRDKEKECMDKIEKIVDHYNSTPATPPGDRAAIKIEMEKAVGEQFDIRQKYRELQIKQLEKELARIRESIQKRNDNRATAQALLYHQAQITPLGQRGVLKFIHQIMTESHKAAKI